MALAQIMKYILPLFAIFVFSSCKENTEGTTKSAPGPLPQEKAFSLTGSYIEGKWNLKSTPLEIGNGMSFVEEGVITFLPTGKFSSNTGLRCYSQSSEKDLFSYSGIDTGTWRVEKGKLVLNYNSMNIDNLKSNIPMITQEFLEEELKDNLGKDEFNRVKSISENSIELIEEAEEQEDVAYQYTRILG